MNTAIYAGTFDPVTNGHLDLIQRAAGIFERVIVAVAKDTGKKEMFSLEERIELMHTVVSDVPGVEVAGFEGLLVEYAKQMGVGVLIRGLRAFSDFEYELQIGLTNRKLDPEIETLYLMPSEQYSFISSSRVRELANLKANTSLFVPEVVDQALKAKVG